MSQLVDFADCRCLCTPLLHPAWATTHLPATALGLFLTCGTSSTTRYNSSAAISKLHCHLFALLGASRTWKSRSATLLLSVCNTWQALCCRQQLPVPRPLKAANSVYLLACSVTTVGHWVLFRILSLMEFTVAFSVDLAGGTPWY